MHIFRILLFFGFVVSLGCQSGQRLAGTSPKPLPLPTDTIEIRNLDTMFVTPDSDPVTSVSNDLPVYRATNTREIDLIHTKLDLRFDWNKEAVIGIATLTFTPYFYPIETVTLDAKAFKINTITRSGSDQELAYEYDDEKLLIKLGQSFDRDEKVEIVIDYSATPTTGSNGSAAITSDQGLFFINADGSEAPKPQQIWTQGETTFNSRWFPTVDSPNERTTQEIYLTVDEKFVTLSNGLLVSSVANDDHTRTDYWVQDQPHAPYLFAIAVGEFAVVQEKWNDINVSYYVEPAYEDDAKAIFEHTPEMLTFFSELTGVEFPWSKYSQIVVRDYVSGAMENTTCVIFGEFVQKHKRELIDNDNDYIVAHEIFHHWFGDYVTCESWSNLVLNEGFANYAEYLWMEHKDGRDRAEHHRFQERDGYFSQANQSIHPLVDFGYGDKEDMFDQHSYNKGGLVLHMLRKLVGDDAFFSSLNTYLKDHAWSSVEAHDLRLAFEKTTGLDLNWFFDQWYFSQGHPIVEFEWNWNPEFNQLALQIDQIQDPDENPPIFILPTDIDIYFNDGSKIRLPVEVDQRNFTANIPLDKEPVLTVLDPDRTQIAVIIDGMNRDDYQLLLKHPNTYFLRSKAVAQLTGESDSESQKILINCLDDPFWEIRQTAIGGLNWKKHPEIQDKLSQMATDDVHSMVRAAAIYEVAGLGNEKYHDVLAYGINQTDAYPIVAASIRALFEADPDLAEEKISVLQEENQSDIVAALSSIYAEIKDTTNLDYFDKHMKSIDGLPSIDFYGNLEALLEKTSAASLMTWMKKCEDVALIQTISPYTRIAATRTIISYLKRNERKSGKLSSEQVMSLRSMLKHIIATEENDQVLSIYQSFMG